MPGTPPSGVVKEYQMVGRIGRAVGQPRRHELDGDVTSAGREAESLFGILLPV